MHYVQAIIGNEGTLHQFVSAFPQARMAELRDGLVLIPLTDKLSKAVQGTAWPPFERLTSPFGHALSAASTTSPVAYIETEYFGGTGTQAAIVWNNGTVTMEPALYETPSDLDLPLMEQPINRALAILEVTCEPGQVDLFDTVGLGKFRSTEEWAKAAKPA